MVTSAIGSALSAPPFQPRRQQPSVAPASMGVAPHSLAQPLGQHPKFSSIRNLSSTRLLNNLFDYDAVPEVKWANMSLQDFSISAMVIMLYIPQTLIAFAYNQHRFETLGRNITMFVSRILLGSITKSSQFSINSWFLDSAMQDKHLFNPHQEFKGLGGWWKKNVHQFIQTNWGLDGDPGIEIMRGVGRPFKETDRSKALWTKLKENSLGTFEAAAERQFGFIEPLDSMRTWAWRVKNGLYSEAEAQEAFGKVAHNYLQNELLKDISPTITVKESFKGYLQQVLKGKEAGALTNPLEQQWVGRVLERSLRLYTHLPSAKPKQVQAWYQGLMAELQQQPPAQREQLLSKAADAYCEKIQAEWEKACAEVKGPVLDKLNGSFKSLLAVLREHEEPRTVEALIAETQHRLAHTIETKGERKLMGELPKLLEPLIQSNLRRLILQQFRDRRDLFFFIQVCFMSLLNAVLVGQLAMTFVFHTFARLDHDFDPSHFEKKRRNPAPPPTASASSQASPVDPAPAKPTVSQTQTIEASKKVSPVQPSTASSSSRSSGALKTSALEANPFQALPLQQTTATKAPSSNNSTLSQANAWVQALQKPPAAVAIAGGPSA